MIGVLGGGGQQLVDGDGLVWTFDAGAVSLEFVYTGVSLSDTALDAGGHAWELLPGAGALGAWLADRIAGIGASDATDRDHTDALALRAALGRLYAAAADGETAAPDDVDTLNLFAALPDVAPALAGGNRQAGAGRVRVAQALSTLAREAIGVLAAEAGADLADPASHRVRRCAADDCRMLFHDVSRTGTRRWCAMERCGNRAKVRAHRARQRARREAAGGALPG